MTARIRELEATAEYLFDGHALELDDYTVLFAARKLDKEAGR